MDTRLRVQDPDIEDLSLYKGRHLTGHDRHERENQRYDRGTMELDTGEWISGLVCEPAALDKAEDITAFGSWRAYLAARQATP